MALQKETTEVERERIIADCYTYRGRMAHTVICMLIGSLKVKMDRPNYFAFLVFLAHEEDDGILGQTNRKVDNGIPRIFFSNYLFPPSKKQKNDDNRRSLQYPHVFLIPSFPKCPDVLLLFLCRPF